MTVTPGTPSPLASRTWTTSDSAAASPATSVCPSPPTLTIAAGAPGGAVVPVAVKVAGLPASPDTVAVSVLGPAAAPRVQAPPEARPCASVVASAAPMLPPPLATAKDTETPATGLPAPSRTLTTGFTGTGEPAVAVWLSPASFARAAAAPAVMAKPAEVTDARPGAVKTRVRVPTVPLMPSATNVAMPLPLVVAAAVPVSVPPPELRAAVTTVPLPAELPLPSTARTWGCGERVPPLGPPPGSVTMRSAVAGPAIPVPVKDVLNPAALARTVFPPTTSPRVHSADASPLPSV